MTPKEKAEDLVKKYLLKVKINSRTLGESNITITNGEIILQTAIQCALIAVDEIIEGVERAFDEYEEATGNYVKNRIFYWDFYSDVKSEIYKL
jgi:hypothetical protein